MFDDEPVIVTSYHHEKPGLRLPGVAIYSQTMAADPKKILHAIIVPNEPRLHIFAITLDGEKIDFNIPEIKVNSPQAESLCGGKEMIATQIKGESIVKAEYSLDNAVWTPLTLTGNEFYGGTLDTTILKDGAYKLFVRAVDRIGQIGQIEENLYIYNKVAIVAPLADGTVYKTCAISAIPKAHSDIEKIFAVIDKGKEIPLVKNEKGLYEAVWTISAKYKPQSVHTITVTEIAKNGVRESDSIKVTIGMPLKGHSIKVDKNIMDWVGIAPAENTWTVNADEFIWTDAKNDDTGPGQYKYPTNKAFEKSSDLREFRVTYDIQNLYFMIKCSRPGDWWAPFRLIGIDTNGVEGGLETKGMITLPGQAKIKVAPNLACEYAVGISGTYKGFVWDSSGKVIAEKKGGDKDTEGFQIDDYNWNNVEVAIPWSLLGGKPSGKTWRFIVAVGQQDNDHFREVYQEATEWHGGGGQGSDGKPGSSPNCFDLASPSSEIQAKELGSYKGSANPGDPDGFCTIKDSYVTVTFAK